MTTQDILKLEPSEESIILINEYLQSSSHSFTVYQTVFVFLEQMKFSMGFFKQVFDEGVAHIEKYGHPDFLENHEKLLSLIIQSAIHLNHLDDAMKYIELRKQALPMMKKYEVTKDIILYKRALNQSYEQDVLFTLNDVMPDFEKMHFYKALLELYIKQDEDQKALELIDNMSPYDTEESSQIIKLKLLYKLGNYKDAKKLGVELINHESYRTSSFIVLLEIYIREKDMHRLSILEADFEEHFDDLTTEQQVRVFDLLSTFYKEVKNKISFDFYSKKLKAAQKKLEKNKNEIKNEPTMIDKVSISEESQVLTSAQFETKEVKNKVTSSHLLLQLEWIYELLSYSHQISESKSLRDYLRSFFMKSDEFFQTFEYGIYLSKPSLLFQYKKERLYDKEVIRNYVYETVCEEVLHDGIEICDKPSALKFDKNIITQKPYEDNIKYVFAYPMSDLGVFLVHLSEDIIDPSLYYDVFKMMSVMILNQLVDEEKLGRLRRESNFLNKVIESPLIAVRTTTHNYSTYNIEAQKILNAETHLPLELFLIDLEYHFVKQYQETLKELFDKPNQTKELTYLYQNKHIRERLYSIKDEDEIKVMSVFEDLTQTMEERDRLTERATIDFETNLLNLNALNEHMPLYIKDKGSFVLIELDDTIKTVYGYELTLQFFKEFGQLTKKYFNEGMVYRFNTYQLFLYLPYNDIRTVGKAIKDYLRYITDFEPQTIFFERFRPTLSIIRYPVVTEEKLPAKLYRFLELTLDVVKSKDRPEDDKYEFFEYSIFEEDQFEQQVINYLNEAIEHKQLELTFNQIIDSKRNMVWQYESELILSNVDIETKYLFAVAKKRHRITELDRYHLKLVCEYLNFLEKDTDRLVKITVPISKETFIEADFNAYLIGLFKTYKIPAEFIRLKIKAADFRSHQYIEQINELTDLGVAIDSTLLDAVLNYPFHALHLDFKKPEQKWLDFLSVLKTMLDTHQIALVIRNVATKQQKEILNQHGIVYIEGRIYKKIAPGVLVSKIKEKS